MLRCYYGEAADETPAPSPSFILGKENEKGGSQKIIIKEVICEGQIIPVIGLMVVQFVLTI